MNTSGNSHEARSALILYGTETGNAQDLADELSYTLRRYHFVTSVRELDSVKLPDLIRHTLVVFAVSTTGQGDFPVNSRQFWQSLLRKKLTATSLQHLQYALVGLCDSSYPKFNLAARKLHKRLQQLGAVSILQTCEADEQGEEGTEGAFLSWLQLLEEVVLKHFPLPVGQDIIAPGTRLPSPWSLVELCDNGIAQEPVDSMVHAQPTKALSNVSFSVVLERNDRVTPKEHWQDVRFLRLRGLHPVSYMPGDALAIRPKNCARDVEQLIELQDWQRIADKPLKFHATDHLVSTDTTFDLSLSKNATYSLRQLLTDFLDINAIPRRSFFSKIAHLTDDEMQKERAQEFADPQYLDEYFDYATRPRRSILEVLQEFHTVKIPWQEAINTLPLLRPRQFSIASGGKLKEGGFAFELLVAIVKYKTVIKRIREGVCTKYLAAIPPGTTLDVVLHTEGRFHLNRQSLYAPHILIGGGTGIAPLRSLIHEQRTSIEPSQQSVLIFGCRNAHADYFFHAEWTELESSTPAGLKIITAFSRDQKGKVYVQDRMKEHRVLLRDTLQQANSTILVCGSSGAMPKAVRRALIDILIDDNTSESMAEQTLQSLEKTNRYKQETW